MRIAAIVRDAGVPHDSVLKDHALSYLLAGIAGVPQLRRRTVFKGGTALRKCYFADYRYSRDLDFTTRDVGSGSAEEFLALLGQACSVAEESTAQFGAYAFSVRRAPHRSDHQHDQLDFRVDVSFPTGANDALKVEITQQEPIVFDTREMPILHGFVGEHLHATIPVYSLDEIVVEKLRGLLQVRAVFEKRGWTNRARDVFDLYTLRRAHSADVHWARLLEPLRAKAAARHVEFTGVEDFLAPEVLAAYREQWDHQLENLVSGQLPPFDEAEATLREILADVFGTTAAGGDG